MRMRIVTLVLAVVVGFPMTFFSAVYLFTAAAPDVALVGWRLNKPGYSRGYVENLSPRTLRRVTLCKYVPVLAEKGGFTTGVTLEPVFAQWVYAPGRSPAYSEAEVCDIPPGERMAFYFMSSTSPLPANIEVTVEERRAKIRQVLDTD